ncbi:hypothetical protein [Vibrio fluvialis]|uniref:hypothetical protein n=1 Tax=Vibrio fluvialis TaxID=676 RepID=UPI001EEAF03C|nr:hypothetical protein [Vibrio fluvialis]MCG6387553.1 hypothetical protein [Vibrio fluvialis]
MTAIEFNEKYPVGTEFYWRPFAFLQGQGILVKSTGDAFVDRDKVIVPIFLPEQTRFAEMTQLKPAEAEPCNK